MFLFITHSPHGNQDILGFWIPRRGCPIAGTGFQSFSVELGFWILDSGFQSLVGFLEQ